MWSPARRGVSGEPGIQATRKRKACPMRRFTRKNYRAIVVAAGTLAAVSATTGLSVLADIRYH